MTEKPSIDEIADDIIKGVKRLMAGNHWFKNKNDPLTTDQAIAIMGIAIQCDTRNELCEQLEHIEDKLDNIAVALENINEAAQRGTGGS